MSAQLTAFGGFAIVAALLTVTPGVDTMLVLRTAVAAGRRSGLVAGAGVLTGLLAWAGAAGLGVAALLAASESAYTLLRVVGAGYLAFLGLRLLWRTVSGAVHAKDAVAAPAASPVRAYVQGLLTNLLNPKVGVFYISLLPQFVVPGHSVLLVTLGLALIHVGEGAVWFLVVTWLAMRMGAVLRRQAVRRGLDAITGAAFVGFAARLALASRP